MFNPNFSKIRNICFFSHYHNGDIFHSKEFVRDIIKQTKFRGYYAHDCATNIISDVDVETVRLPPIDRNEWYGAMNDTFFLNTWIGAHFIKELEYNGECSLRFNYSMYRRLYDDLNKTLGTNLKLLPLVDYFPTIDFKKYRTESIEEFIVSLPKKRKILISNGPCLSTQCEKYKDMTSTTIKIIERYPDIIFFATTKLNYKAQNLFYTDDVTAPRIGCDLNEIAYISRFCDTIIGRNSGPYCFATMKENVLNPNKTFFAFGEREADSFYHGINTPCKFVFHKFETEDKLNEHLFSVIEGV